MNAEEISVLLVEDDPGEPVDSDRFGEIVRQIDEFFVGIFRLPPRKR
jgi:hypothetical protein